MWNEVLDRIGGKEYDSRRIQREFAGFAELYGESGLLRRYDSTSGSYVEMYAEQRGNGSFGSEVPSNNRVFSDRKGSLLETEQSGLRDNGILTKNNKSYSAQASEAAQRITENFGYTDATANNIVRAARSLKQRAGSKADTNELAYTIASTLESRRNGNTDSRDAERIAMMIADDTKAVNEDYIETYKPILDRLNGMKISISEADSFLGNAYLLFQNIYQLQSISVSIYLTPIS